MVRRHFCNLETWVCHSCLPVASIQPKLCHTLQAVAHVIGWVHGSSNFIETINTQPVCVQDTVLAEHTERLKNAVNMAQALQRNEETLLKDRIAAVSTCSALYVVYSSG